MPIGLVTPTNILPSISPSVSPDTRTSADVMMNQSPASKQTETSDEPEGTTVESSQVTRPESKGNQRVRKKPAHPIMYQGTLPMLPSETPPDVPKEPSGSEVPYPKVPRVQFNEFIYEEESHGSSHRSEVQTASQPTPKMVRSRKSHSDSRSHSHSSKRRPRAYEIWRSSKSDRKEKPDPDEENQGLAYFVSLMLVFNYTNVVTLPIRVFYHGGLGFLFICTGIKFFIRAPLTYLFLFIGRRAQAHPFQSIWTLCPIMEGAVWVIFLLELCTNTQLTIDTTNFFAYYLTALADITNDHPNYTAPVAAATLSPAITVFPPSSPDELSFISMFLVFCIVLMAGLLHYVGVKAWRSIITVLATITGMCFAIALLLVPSMRDGSKEGVQWMMQHYVPDYGYAFARDVVIISTKIHFVEWVIVGQRSIRDGQSLERLIIWIQSCDALLPFFMCVLYAAGFGIAATWKGLPLTNAVERAVNQYPLMGTFRVLSKAQNSCLFLSLSLMLCVPRILSVAYQISICISVIYQYVPLKKSALSSAISLLGSGIFCLAVTLLSLLIHKTGAALFFYHYTAPAGFSLSVSTILICACYVFPDMRNTITSGSGNDSPILFYIMKYFVPPFIISVGTFALISIGIEYPASREMSTGEAVPALYATASLTLAFWLILWVVVPFVRVGLKKQSLKELALPRGTWLGNVAEVSSEKSSTVTRSRSRSRSSRRRSRKSHNDESRESH